MTAYFNPMRFPWLVIAGAIWIALIILPSILIEYMFPDTKGMAFNIAAGIVMLGIGIFSLWAGRRIWRWFELWFENREWSLLAVIAISALVAVIVFLGLVLGSGMR
jgi:hypothetical protein